MSLDTYLTLQEATQRYKLDPQLLTRYINDGRIRGGKLNGTLVLSERDTQQVAEQQVEKKRFKHLDGREIHLSEASRKYNIPMSSLSRWADQGKIAVMGTNKNRRLLNEADVAYIRALIDAKGGHKRGRSLFD